MGIIIVFFEFLWYLRIYHGYKKNKTNAVGCTIDPFFLVGVACCYNWLLARGIKSIWCFLRIFSSFYLILEVLKITYFYLYCNLVLMSKYFRILDALKLFKTFKSTYWYSQGECVRNFLAFVKFSPYLLWFRIYKIPDTPFDYILKFQSFILEWSKLSQASLNL
jgi:hypothetical protein